MPQAVTGPIKRYLELVDNVTGSDAADFDLDTSVDGNALRDMLCMHGAAFSSGKLSLDRLVEVLVLPFAKLFKKTVTSAETMFSKLVNHEGI